MNKTIFEKIISKEIPANFHYEDEDIIAIDDINPVAPIHILIIPKKRIETLNDLKDEDFNLVGKLFEVTQMLVKKLKIDKKVTEQFLIVMKTEDKPFFIFIFI